MGYVKAGSKVSLIMGAVSAIVIFTGLYLSKANMKMGFGLISAMSALLVATFIVRLVKTGSFMPSGMLVILSIIATVVSVKQFMGK